MVSLLLYALACCLPALEFQKGLTPESKWGAEVLAIGWSGIFAGVFGWYANPFWALGLLCAQIQKPIPAAIAGAISLAIGCTTFWIIGRVLPGDEGGVTTVTVTRLLPGCYVWLASLAAIPLAAIVHSSTKR